MRACSPHDARTDFVSTRSSTDTVMTRKTGYRRHSINENPETIVLQHILVYLAEEWTTATRIASVQRLLSFSSHP